MRHTRRGITQRAFAALTLLIVGLGTMIFGFTSSATAVDVEDECVPADSYTEESDWVTTSPGTGWYQIDERTVTDQAASTETSDWLTAAPAGEGWVQIEERTTNGAVIDEGHWQRYSYNGSWDSQSAPPFPDPKWQPNVKGDPHGVGQAGAYDRSNEHSGNVDWFYLEWNDATYEQVTQYKYQREVAAVTHQEYRYAYDHEAVTCEPEVCPEGTLSAGAEIPEGETVEWCGDIAGNEPDYQWVGAPSCDNPTVARWQEVRYRAQNQDGTWEPYGPWSKVPGTDTMKSLSKAEAAKCGGKTPGPETKPNASSLPNPGSNPGGGEPEVLGIEANAPAAAPTAVDAGLTAQGSGSNSSTLWILAGGALALAGLVLGFSPATPRGKRTI